MAESTLSLVYADFVREVERYLRITAGTETTWVDDILRAGCRKVYSAHDWQFLRVTATLSTVAPYSTGTVEVVDGVVTLTGGTFPAWAASGVLIVNNVSYEINTRDGNTQVTLDDLTVDVDSGTNYQLVQQAYDLPDGFGQLLSPLTYHPGLTAAPPITLIDERDLRMRRQTFDQVAPPCHAALREKAFTASTGLRVQVLFDPLPDAVYQLTYRYRVHPDKLATTHFPMGGMVHAETFRLAILAAAELSRLDQAGHYEALFQQQLAISIRRDAEMHAADSLGLMTAHEPLSWDGAQYSRIDRGSPYPPYTD